MMTEPVAKIEGDEIVIRLPIEAIPNAVAMAPESAGLYGVKVTNARQAAEAICMHLSNSNGEDGRTPIHTIVDDAIRAAVEWGDEGFELTDGEI